MMREEKMVNVIMKDGNRIVNWDFDPNETVRSVITRWNFAWEPNTVRVCGVLMMPENMLDHPLKDYMYEPSKVYDYPKRVYIEMAQPKKEKKEEPENVG